MKTVLLKAQGLRPLSAEGEFLSPALDLQIESGEVVFLSGDNGSGKSTLLKTLLGLHRRYQGTFSMSLAASQVQYLPQLGNLNFHLPLSLRDVLHAPTEDSILLQGLDLSKKWNTASGGERQKVMLASLLARQPRLLILDEPFNHVDQESVQTLEQALSDFFKTSPESALLIVSHRSVLAFMANARTVELQ